MARFDIFSDEQARAAVNLGQRYAAWMEAERVLADLPYDLRRKQVGRHAYLYEISDRAGNGRSLGAWNDEVEARFRTYRRDKASTKERRDIARDLLGESGRLCRALRLPMLASAAGPILREADRRRLLDGTLLVIGTNAMAAYAYTAGGFIRDAPDETDDFDLAWSAREPPATPGSVWTLLKAVDPTFTVNTERTFQARNAKAYEVELLVAPSRIGTLDQRDQPRPVPLPEQEWLLMGVPVDQIVSCRDGSPARIVAPDPRWFALHKLWMADKPSRSALKKPKDARQGNALLDTVQIALPQYPLDDGFRSTLPGDLVPHFDRWRSGSGGPGTSGSW